MPEVISDTSALQYLHQTHHLDLLRDLYGTLTVPEGVAEELVEGRALGHPLLDLERHEWIRVIATPNRRTLLLASDLGKGEREVISLAVLRLAGEERGFVEKTTRFDEDAGTGAAGVVPVGAAHPGSLAGLTRVQSYGAVVTRSGGDDARTVLVAPSEVAEVRFGEPAETMEVDLATRGVDRDRRP